MNIIITGKKQVGKSTLVKKIVEALVREQPGLKLGGFETRKKSAAVYIYEFGKPHVQSEENLVGLVNDRTDFGASASKGPTPCPEAFQRFVPILEESANKADLIIMDEIGFLESSSDAFCQAVLKILNGTTPVIAVVRDKDTPFLNRVRSTPNSRLVVVTEENRDEPVNNFI